jgi:hypothetical protein
LCFYWYSNYGTRLASRVRAQKEHGLAPKPRSFSSEPCTMIRYTARETYYIIQYIPFVASRGALSPIADNYRYAVSLRIVPPPTSPSSIASTIRPICLGANVPKRGPRKPEVVTGHGRRNKLRWRRPSPPRS